MKNNFILSAGLFLAAAFSTQAQIVGGTGNSEMTPKVAGPGKLSTGSFKGDVNLFTGDYNTTYPLGSVSTPGGLNFTLTYSYSSPFTIGATPQVCRGIPYGEGWSLNIPTVSVETDVFNNFTFSQICNENSALGNTLLRYSGAQAEAEGDVYWLSPEINIPGVASGRGVFKYVDVADDKSPVFVLNEFENPIEIRFKSGKWEVLLPDGTKYFFAKAIKSTRAPSNARTLFYDQNELTTGDNAVSDQYLFDELNSSVVNNIMPKESYNVWYCSEITNPNYFQQTISFYYDSYGPFNYYQEFLQPAFKNALVDVADVSTFAFNADFTMYTDLLLRQIVSGGAETPIDKLVLNYRTNSLALGQSEAINFHTDPNAVRIDSLYTATPVYSIKGNDDFNSWKRYNHSRKTGLGGTMLSNSDPYLRTDGYQRDFISGEDKIKFDHGFLESERISSGVLYPGDIYEIRSKVTRDNANDPTMGNGTIDIAVVTGNNGSNYLQTTGTPLSDNETQLSRVQYNLTKGIELYSTFNMAMKWQMSDGENVKQTSNFFVMPNIPESFQGINIQVGPGNSDMDFNYGSGSMHYGDFRQITNSTVHYNSLVPYTFVSPGRELRSAAGVSHNFGVGLPWSNILPLVKRMAEPIPVTMNTLFDPILPYFDFWWTNNQSDIENGYNKPTKFDDHTYLDEFELIRYSKNPLMLESVEQYSLNGNDRTDGWKLTTKKQFSYRVNREGMVENFAFPPNSDGVALVPNSRHQLQILLTAIREVPVDYDYQANDTTLLQTTFFGYGSFLKDVNTYYELLPNNGYRGMVLNTVVDPLGGITRIVYYNYSHPLTYSNFNFDFPSHCTSSWSDDFGYTNVVEVHPVVRFVVQNDENDLDLTQVSTNPLSRRTEYLFDNATVTGIDKKLIYTNETNFRSRSEHPGFTGFGKVSVKNTKLASGEQNYTDYEHFTNLDTNLTETEKYLYYGKLKAIKSYDHAGLLHSEKFFRYENTHAFQNGYLRPNPYREHIGYEEKYYDPLLHEYEYRDYYREEYVEAGGLEGEAAYSLLDIPRFTGTGGILDLPKFLEFQYFRMLEAENAAYRLDSYFVRTAEEIDRSYENMLWRSSQTIVTPNGPGTFKESNPNGPGKTNAATSLNDEAQLLMLSGATPNAANTSNSLVADSPLSEAVLSAVVTSTKLNTQQKSTVLRAQNGLSNAIWDAILLNERKFSPQQLLSLVEKQSYFADATLMKLIELNHKNLDPKVFEAMLLKKEFLSNQVMLALLETTGYVGSKSFTEVFTRQPHMTEEILVKVSESPHVVTNSLPDILKSQDVTPAVYRKLIDRADIHGSVLATIVENDPVYPDEATLLHLLDRVPLPEHKTLVRVFAAAKREIEASVEQKVFEKVPELPKRKEILGETVRLNQLNLYCANELQQTRSYIESKTTYAYYEADYRGATDGRAYQTLLALGDFPRTIPLSQTIFGGTGNRVIDKVYLKHEPSFQLFSKKVISPQQPGAYLEEQYFYTYDLKNRYDRYWFNYDILDGSASKSGIDLYQYADLTDTLGYGLNWHQSYWQNNDAIYILPKYDAMTYSRERNLRQLPFQTTVFSKNVNDTKAAVRSEYFHYDARLNVRVADTREESFTEDPCDPEDPGPDPVTGCAACSYQKLPHSEYWEGVLLSDVPYGYCLWQAPSIGYYICPSEYTVNPCDPNALLLECNSSATEGSSGLGENETPAEMILLTTALKNTLQLKRSFVQLDTLAHSDFFHDKIDSRNTYITEFYAGSTTSQDENNFAIDYKIRLPFDHLKTTEVLMRNRFLQPEIVENQVGIKTRFYYTDPVHTHHYNPECPEQGYRSVNFTNIGQPVRVTVGYERPDSMATTYIYTPQGLVERIILPSGHFTDYSFDGFLRLSKVTENGTRLLSRTAYEQWDHDFSLGFTDRTRQNFVYSILYNEYLDNGQDLDTNRRHLMKAFVDPLGREHSVSQQYDLFHLYSGTPVFDQWNRTVRGHKPTALFDSGGTLSLDLRDDHTTPYASSLYENTPKSRMLRAANINVALTDPHTVRSEYALANNVFTSCELGLSRDELTMIMKAGTTGAFRFLRTRTLDQDDRELITYSNAFGQQVATLSYDDNQAKVVTLFAYDSYGNLVRTINPEKQESSWEYNMPGKPVREKTADGGEKRFMYNKHLQVSAIQDQLHRDHRNEQNEPAPMYRSFQYDPYGRLIAQGSATLLPVINPQFGNTVGFYDFFAYQNTTLSGGSDENAYLFDYVYSYRSSLDWLAEYERISESSPYGRVKRGAALAIDEYEKAFVFGADGTQPDVGKLLTAKSYADGRVIQQCDYRYNAEDRVESQVVHFHPEDISQGGGGHIRATIFYPKYNFRGSLEQEIIDLGSDGTIEMHYHYKYDPLNRLTEVYAANALVPQAENATLLVSYEYDNATGLTGFVRHHTQGAPVNETRQVYDVRDRLKGMHSELLAYDLFYDADQPPAYNGESVLSTQNYNGNINGISVTYQFAGTLNQPSNFDFPTIYGYSYDKLNRLVKADALVGDFIADATPLQLQESYLIGDEQYSYDRIGNIKTLQRHKKSEDILLMSELEAWTYAYQTGKNRLVTAMGAAPRGYTYDVNGNLLTDSYRQITSTLYSRGSYPTELLKDNIFTKYVYDVNDLRIFKQTGAQIEYTLKDALNRDIATYCSSSGQWTFNVYGTQLEARLIQNPDPGNAAIANRQATFYLYDHLGNTRVTYTPTVDLRETVDKFENPIMALLVDYFVIYAADYFPYGKLIREFVDGEPERYLSTHHDRDRETGLDYRGARYYDSDIGRFLSTDPWQAKYPGWSTYNYVMGNPVLLIDPSGNGPTDWVKNIETGEYIWDNTVTNQFQAHEGQRYIGKENSDIVKDLFGQTNFTAKTEDWGITGMENGPGYVASSKARVFTTLNVSIQANVTYDGNNRTFNGIDFYASATGTTAAPLTPDKKMDFIATDVNFHGVEMKPLPEGNFGTIKAPVGSGGFSHSWSAKRVYNDFGKSYDRQVNLKGQYIFGGTPLMDFISGTIPNSTAVSLTIPFHNK